MESNINVSDAEVFTFVELLTEIWTIGSKNGMCSKNRQGNYNKYYIIIRYYSIQAGNETIMTGNRL